MAPAGIGCTVESKVSTPITPRTTSVVVKPRACPLLLSESNSRPQPVSAASSMGSSMVFDFRGKDVKPQVAVMPSPIRISREELDGPLEDSTEPCGKFTPDSHEVFEKTRHIHPDPVDARNCFRYVSLILLKMYTWSLSLSCTLT